MELKQKHPLGFLVKFRCLDLNVIFSKRDSDWFNNDRDFCTYIWKDPKGVIQYIGIGRYWDLYKYGFKKWTQSRPFKHQKDMLANTINEDWICEILFIGCTSKEAHIIEAYLITCSERPLSNIKSYVWDGVSLINKKREKRYERMFEEYLNLDNWNNYWETIRREINGY